MLKKLGSKLKEQKGFTLIELLAVIVILGIIAAIAIPAIGNVINNSKEKAQVQEGLQIINAAKYYMNEKNPSGTALTALATAGTGLDSTDLAPYLDRVNDSSFEVLVSAKASGGFLYTLTSHEANDITGGTTDIKTNGATEQELVSWKRN
ncbi:prepilin-type N-terminal cleavage/methylation domain-containing protein [Neobacillus niacini]|uniref:prepilin-type N-terminal cleavage/methylation domain-containing protein n=1 Tax=Neobacillus niacini TaxID=86668 RepID=UPI0007AB35A1|nr:prepilin-type N-terminal cleavage/methylation domain-containing protein [Neobacillus niacini]MEC1521783.1 prepilin-type N-terminal cleavage/methylation domain-containing protein [Neobacillus niacini]